MVLLFQIHQRVRNRGGRENAASGFTICVGLCRAPRAACVSSGASPRVLTSAESPPPPPQPSGFSGGKSAVFETRAAASASVAELLDALAAERALPRASLALFAGAAGVAGTHEPLAEGLSLHAALVKERHAAAQPHGPAASAAHVHDLTLVIDESGRACRRQRRRATLTRARRTDCALHSPHPAPPCPPPPLSPAPVPAPASAKLRDAACADAENGGDDAYVRSAKGEPARHAEDARHHR